MRQLAWLRKIGDDAGRIDNRPYKARVAGSSPVPPTIETKGVTVETVPPLYCLTGGACPSACHQNEITDLSTAAISSGSSGGSPLPRIHPGGTFGGTVGKYPEDFSRNRRNTP